MSWIYHSCPECKHVLETRAALAGFTVVCSECGANSILVPEESTAPAPKEEPRSQRAEKPREEVRYCFFCEEERQGRSRFFRLLTVYHSGAYRVRQWVNFRCFCCNACSTSLTWLNVEIILIFLLGILGGVASCVAYFPFANIPRDSNLRYLAITLLVLVLALPMIGIFGGISWHGYRLRRFTRPEAREKLDTLLGSTGWWRLQERGKIPAGEHVVECR